MIFGFLVKFRIDVDIFFQKNIFFRNEKKSRQKIKNIFSKRIEEKLFFEEKSKTENLPRRCVSGEHFERPGDDIRRVVQ